jgi:sugar phosphate isomerase/epimerase
MGELSIRPAEESARHAEKLSDEAAERGFGVALEALAKLDNSICCFVFSPDDAEDAASHFVAPPVTMKVREPLRSAHQPNAIR